MPGAAKLPPSATVFGGISLPYSRPWRQCFSSGAVRLSAHRRTQDLNAGFSSSYDPSDDAGRGPMFFKAKYGVPQFYPRDLKKLVDDYVIGQGRAKKIICATIFNHYQRLRRKQHQEDAERLLREKQQRQRYARDRDLHERHRESGLDDEFPSHFETSRTSHPTPSARSSDTFYVPENEATPEHVKLDKSNLLLLGPTGVGKTYILETLSKKLNVPFTISDCNSFTQAGYIGQDVETCIERLLVEANYDTRAAEHGIVVLDEFDKIARRETAHGRDVSGEGVQQALLKLVEGTKVTLNVKDGRGPSASASPSSSRSASPTTSTYGLPNGPAMPPATPPASKVDQYVIDTSNILFVFSGAFVGLDHHVLRRVSRPSMGFGSALRVTPSSGSASHVDGNVSGSPHHAHNARRQNSAVLPMSAYAHLPHQPVSSDTDSVGFTPLDLANTQDLQAFGFIPELIGRLHNICSLAPLSLEELYRILTEPRNSLVQQYTLLFETYPSRLHFSRRALYAIAARAAQNETGARGLKMEMERVLAEPMFEAPMPYVLITEACVQGREKAGYWGKDGRFEVERLIQEEDAGLDNSGARTPDHALDSTFEQLRHAGQSGA